MPELAELGPVEVAAIRELVAQRYSLFLGEPHERYIGTRVSERLKELSLSFSQYLEALRTSPDQGGELRNLVERFLCIYETRFMRDPPDFRALACFILPQLAREMRRTGRTRLRVASAGCSTGQEVYTLAMILDEARPEIGDAHVEVVGLDLSTEALEKARRGRYGVRDIAVLDPWRQQRYFRSCGGDEVEVVPSLREKVHFTQANLAVELPITQVDVIFCRNVLIYFNPVLRQEVIRLLLSALRLGGYIVVGSADSLWSFKDILRTMRTSGTIVFQRIKAVPAQAPPPPVLSTPSSDASQIANPAGGAGR